MNVLLRRKSFQPLLSGSLGLAVALISACATTPTAPAPSGDIAAAVQNPDRLLVVDCLLPAKVKQLGQKLTYLAPRRAIRTTQSDCGIRGGEYTAYDRANYATALKIWLPQAQEGDPEAQTYVGEIYEKGLGIQADYILAAAWYRKAAAQGFSRAMINLGYLYESGLGVEANVVEAMNWYRKASGLSDAELEYVSSIERAKRVAAAEETERLRGEVGNLQQQLEEAQRQLQQKQSSLSSERQRAQRLRAQLKVEKERLAVAGSAVGAGLENAKLKTDLKGSEAERQRLQQELVAEKKRVAQLETSLAGQQSKVTATEKALASSRAALAQASEQMADGEKNNQLSAAQLKQLQTEKSQQASEVARLESELQRQRADFEKDKAELNQNLQQSRAEQQRLQGQLSAAQLAGADKGKLQQQVTSVSTRNSELEAALAASDKRVAALEKELAEASYESDEAQASQELAAAKGKSASLQQQLADSRSEQARLQQSLAQAQVGGAAQQSRIAELEAELAQSEASISTQEQEIAALKDKTKAAAPVKEVAAAKVVATVNKGPAIEILDPPVATTRSIPTAFVPAGASDVEVIGKISSALDLLTFKINGEKQAVNDAGIFQISRRVSGKEIPMDMLAIDKNGEKSELKFMLMPQQAAATASSPSPKKSISALSGVDFGEYYALVIGNQEYEQISNLKTPVNDARRIAQILKTKYGYTTKLLVNANRYQILSAMNEMRENLTENDNLLIYYAGHGELDSVNLRGFWLPVDAEPENSANWISNVAITDMLNIMSAKHVMVVADSCYSGSLTRSSIARLQGGMSAEKKKRWYSMMSAARTRTVLTSGGVKPVLDSGGGAHSVFAKAFIDTLNNNEQILEGYQLYRSVQKRVKALTKKLKVEQDPQYAPLKFAGHEAGEYLFLPSSAQSKLDQNDSRYLALN